MKKTFNILGEIVDSEDQRWSWDDVCPSNVTYFLNNLDPDDEVELIISSPGGSCSAGISIANILKASGRKTVAHVVGVAASISSVIACSCDELVMDENSFLMCHLPWSYTVGNVNDLQKDIDVLNKYTESMLSIYKTKFDSDDDAIKKMLENETWILAKDCESYGLKCTVIPSEEPLKVAACSKLPHFLHQPDGVKNLIKVADKKISEKKDEPIAKEETVVPLSEVEKRVSGMQSTMAKQMDSLKKEYEAKINDFKSQLQAKEEELSQEKNKFISLNQDLDRCKEELKETSSALAEKTNALETLNANVNHIPEELPSFNEGLSKCKTPKEKVEFISSGKYVR